MNRRSFDVPMSFALALLLSAVAVAEESRLDTRRIEQLTGAKGQLDGREGVFKVTAPRDDLEVRVAGVKVVPAMGLTSWAAFKRAGEQTVMMGDLTLLADQVSPVMDAALENGLEVTALHNHFMWDQPPVWFMHIGGHGDTEALASAVGQVLTTIRETPGGDGRPPKAPAGVGGRGFDPSMIERVLGHKGELTAGVYKVTIGRTTRMHGHEMGGAMGVNTWAAFAGSDDQAVVDGDFAMYEAEVQRVLRALRRHGIHVVAIHNHMIGEQPRIVFLHYWGTGPAEKLAQGLRAALDEQDDVRSEE